MSPCLLGIDSGLTVTKAVIFDEEGHERGSGAASNIHQSRHPRRVEQDMQKVWENCQEAVRRAIRSARVRAEEISGVGIAGHGDGVYLVDESGKPVHPGILSLDSRAHGVLQRWEESGITDRALQLTGMKPFAALPPVLLSWFKENEPEVLERTRWVLYVKDWLRYKLTGEYATDPTEASSGFTDVETQRYSPEAFSLYDLEEVRGKLPPVVGCAEVVGEVSGEATGATGLASGTPVVAGTHDIDASAIGVGCVRPGDLTMIAGTWSINEVVSEGIQRSKDWATRNFVSPGLWMNVSASPASAANLEWFVQRLCSPEVDRAAELGVSPFYFVNEEVKAVLGEKSGVFYHPFLYGSPYGDEASGGFFGLRGWHTRGHLLRAIFEGTVFNHKIHVEALRSGSRVERVRLTGGGSRSEAWSQMFADALNETVEITDAGESGALGAAICAGMGTGVYGSLEDATRKTVRLLRSHEPDPERRAHLAEAYETYTALAEALKPVWPRLSR